jgi:hypothetical protein
LTNFFLFDGVAPGVAPGVDLGVYPGVALKSSAFDLFVIDPEVSYA